jgi:hypothetical protein
MIVNAVDDQNRQFFTRVREGGGERKPEETTSAESACLDAAHARIS